MEKQSKPENSPLVSVIVVTLNASVRLRGCLDSLKKQSFPNAEIIVVDNGSTEDIRGLIKKEFPAVKYIRLETNTGFAAGNNTGIRNAGGKYIALLNNDAIAGPDWISAMIKTIESEPDIGAVASLVVDGNNSSILDSFGVGIALDGMSRQAERGAYVADYTATRQVLAVSGCACMFRKEALDRIGLFDERFFAYCEDTDLCLRLYRAGWKLLADPKAIVIHFYSQTEGAFSAKKVFWVERNHFWVALKNFPIALLPAVPVFTMWRLLIQLTALLKGNKAITSFTKSGGFTEIASAIIRAHLSALAGIPSAISGRLGFRRNKRISGKEMTGLILKFKMPMREIILGKS